MQVTTTSPRIRRSWLVLAGVLALTLSLIGPAGQAEAAEYGKPKVTVAAISGGAALKISWNGQKSSKTGAYATTYRVFYGTSKTKSKAKAVTVNLSRGHAGNNNGSASKPVYVLNNLSTKSTYYIWVQAWNSSTNKAVGDLSAVKSKKTSGYDYKAPPTIRAVNAGKNSVELAWGTITGAPTYRIKAVGGGQTLYGHSGAEGTMVVTGLKAKTKYTFTASVEAPPTSSTPGYVKMSAESKAKTSATTLASSLLNAPTELGTRDDPTYAFDKDGQRPNSIDLTWLAPAGFDPDNDRFQIDYATTQDMKSGAGYFRLKKDDGDRKPQRDSKNSKLGEFIVDTSAAPMMAMMDVQMMELPVAPVELADPEEPLEEPTEPIIEPTQVPTTEPSQEPSVTPTPEPSESATEQPETEQPTEAPASESPEAEAEQLHVFAAAPAAANPGPVRYWGRIFGLSSNKNLYLRIKVIDKNNKVKSERTTALMAKTLSPKGYITGKVTLPAGEIASHYVVAAYKDKSPDLHDQAEVQPNGTYQLSVRPGSYQVQAVYIGPGNYSSRWAASDATRGRTRSDSARKVSVSVAKATTGVNITPQSTRSYSLSGKISCPGASSSQCTVDVSAMSDWGTSRVVNQVRSNSSGSYTITGLPAGKYKLRITHSEERYKVLTRKVEIKSDGTVSGSRNGTLTPRAWVKSYTPKIARTGSTVKVSSKAWIASELPVVRGVQKCQWQRNGVNIKGATKCTYQLTAADRGKQIRVRIKNSRYGFVDNTGYSKAIRG